MAEVENSGLSSSGDVRPIPDPTLLTQSLVERDIRALKEILTAMITGIRDNLTTRLDGMDRALQVVERQTERQPSEVDFKLSAIDNLHQEKFHSIEGRLLERDKRFEQGGTDAKIALNIALEAQREKTGAELQAAKEAVGKSEVAFSKQIDQLARQGEMMSQSLDTKITDMKDRLEAALNSVALRAEAANSALRAELLPQITGEKSRGDRGEGRQLGQGAVMALMLGGMAVLGTISAIIFGVLRAVS